MGFKQAAVLTPVSFFLGVLFICFNVDHKLLWGSLTDDVVGNGFQFYTTFFNAPPAIKALLHGMVGVGLIGLIAKLHEWDDSAMFFDGSSLAAYVFSVAIYITITIPALRTMVTPLENIDTPEDQVNAMRILAAGNVINVFCLGFILLLQAGQEYVRRTERNALSRIEEEKKKKAASAATDKKDQ